MGFIITLILVGLVLIFAEILLIPGVGVAGILGILSMRFMNMTILPGR